MFVATTLLKASQSLRVFSALPEKMPCVTRATISEAPCSRRVSAALARVPHVSGRFQELAWWVAGEEKGGVVCGPAMSSTRMAHLSFTFPTRVICSDFVLALAFRDEGGFRADL